MSTSTENLKEPGPQPDLKKVLAAVKRLELDKPRINYDALEPKSSIRKPPVDAGRRKYVRSASSDETRNINGSTFFRPL